jgi:hypothetical protein
MNDSHSFFAGWHDFYVIIGSAAASLTGLVFVVITLVAQRRNEGAVTGLGTSIFSSPTVVLFCAALFIASVCTAPWPSAGIAGTLIGLTGLTGIVYALRIMVRARQLESYQPDLSDWVWFTLLPLLASAAVCISGFMLVHAPLHATFALAGATILLVFIGIHNAWDVIVYMVIADEEE